MPTIHPPQFDLSVISSRNNQGHGRVKSNPVNTTIVALMANNKHFSQLSRNSEEKSGEFSIVPAIHYSRIYDLPYLPMYKSTFYSLKICPKNHPRLIHGSKTEIIKSSGQISIIIVSYSNKNPLLHSTSYDVYSLINLSSSSEEAVRIIPQHKAACCRYTLAQLWNKELTFVANKVASPLNESHISCFQSLQLGNQALYRAIFFHESKVYLKGNSKIKDLFLRKYSHRNDKKHTFWLQKGGSTYARVNTVVWVPMTTIK